MKMRSDSSCAESLPPNDKYLEMLWNPFRMNFQRLILERCLGQFTNRHLIWLFRFWRSPCFRGLFICAEWTPFVRQLHLKHDARPFAVPRWVDVLIW
jgi:hypothetical protein